jgi:hypothetical protein
MDSLFPINIVHFEDRLSLVLYVGHINLQKEKSIEDEHSNLLVLTSYNRNNSVGSEKNFVLYNTIINLINNSNIN